MRAHRARLEGRPENRPRVIRGHRLGLFFLSEARRDIKPGPELKKGMATLVPRAHKHGHINLMPLTLPTAATAARILMVLPHYIGLPPGKCGKCRNSLDRFLAPRPNCRRYLRPNLHSVVCLLRRDFSFLLPFAGTATIRTNFMHNTGRLRQIATCLQESFRK